jgi:F0F1-type ATP synthase assembly protein I
LLQRGGYSVTPHRPDDTGEERRPSPSGESVAFLILGGVATGAGVGAGVGWLVGQLPLCMVVGVFVGFALALYAVYLETRPR